MAYKLTNEDKRVLRIIADHLPLIMDSATERERMTVKEVRDRGHVTRDDVDQEGISEKIEGKDDDLKDVSTPVQVQRNHYRRLIHAWEQGGQEQITRYQREVVDLWKKNFKMEGTYATRTIKGGGIGKIITMFGPATHVEVTFIDINEGRWQTVEELPEGHKKETVIEYAKQQIREKVVSEMLNLQYDKMLQALAIKEGTPVQAQA